MHRNSNKSMFELYQKPVKPEKKSLAISLLKKAVIECNRKRVQDKTNLGRIL